MPFTAVARANILQNIVQFNAGSATTPGISFVTQPSTGLFLSGANVGVSVGGVEKANVSSSGFTVNGSVSATTFVGNGSQLTGISSTPSLSIANVQITDSSYTVSDDLAVSTTLGGYIVVNGIGFAPGSMVSVGTDLALATSYVSGTQLRAQLPPKSSGSYAVGVTRGDTVTASLPLALTYSASPVWSTSTDLGNTFQNQTFARTLSAPSDSAITYANITSLPPGVTVSSNGVLTGNITSVGTESIFTFGIQAQDAEYQDSSRTFSLQYYLEFIARKLTASDKAFEDYFGQKVAMTSDGTRIILGATGVDSLLGTSIGAAYIFVKFNSLWSQETKLTASDGVSSDYFGQSVSINSDGSRVIVGAPNASPGGTSNAGAAYIFTRSGTNWTQESKLTANDKAVNNYFGQSASMNSDGSRVISSAYGANTYEGAVYVFTRSGTSWTQEAKLSVSDPVQYTYFGSNLSINSDATRVIAGRTSSNGAAYVFSRSGTTWTQEAKLTASDGVSGDAFGQSVSINSDGTRAIIGAHVADLGGITDVGAAYIFVRSGTSWTQEAKLTANDGAVSNYFGVSASMNSDGSRVIVGAYNSSPGGVSNAGAAYVFSRSGTTWTQESKLTASDGKIGDYLGYSVSMSGSGTQVVIGSGYIDPGGIVTAGAAYVCVYGNGAWVSY